MKKVSTKILYILKYRTVKLESVQIEFTVPTSSINKRTGSEIVKLVPGLEPKLMGRFHGVRVQILGPGVFHLFTFFCGQLC